VFLIVCILVLVLGSITIIHATILFNDGFETNDFSAWDGTTGSPATSSDYAHHGTYSVKIDASETVYKSITNTADARYIRSYVYFVTLPTSDVYQVGICGFAPAGFHGYPFFATAYKDPADSTVKFALRDTYFNNWNITAIEPNTGEWYYVEVKYIKSGTGELYVDGTLRATLSCPAVNTDYSFVGSPEGTQGTGYIDCVVVADTYIGPEEEGQNIFETFEESLTVASSIIDNKEKHISYGESNSITSSITDTKEKHISYGESSSVQVETTTQKEQGMTMSETVYENPQISSILITTIESAITMIETIFQTPKVTASLIIALDEEAAAVSAALIFGILGFVLAISAIGLVLAKKEGKNR